MKVQRISLLQEVTSDLSEGKSFYDRREAGIGDYFLYSVIADIESLLIYAGIHSKKHGFYRMLAKRFPYAVYYYIVEETAHVVAVLPSRLDPASIKTKLDLKL